MTSTDLQWFAKADLHQYSGQYIIIADKQVVLHGNNLKELVTSFRKQFPQQIPQIAKISTEKQLMLSSYDLKLF